MKDHNLPEFHIAAIGVRHLDGTVEVRLRSLMTGGEWHTLKSWRGPSGRLDAGQVEDLQAAAGSLLGDLVLSAWGVQALLR